MVTLVGWFGDHPGGSDREFLEFARSLDAPDLYEAIRDAEPLSPVALHRFPSNRRRHYELVRDLPTDSPSSATPSAASTRSTGRG